MSHAVVAVEVRVAEVEARRRVMIVASERVARQAALDGVVQIARPVDLDLHDAAAHQHELALVLARLGLLEYATQQERGTIRIVHRVLATRGYVRVCHIVYQISPDFAVIKQLC